MSPLFTQFSKSSFGQSLVSAPWIILQVLWDCCKTTESSTDLFFSSLFDCVVFFLLPFFRDVDGHKVGHDRTGLDCTSWDWGEFTGHSVHCVVLIMSNTPGYVLPFDAIKNILAKQMMHWHLIHLTDLIDSLLPPLEKCKKKKSIGAVMKFPFKHW